MLLHFDPVENQRQSRSFFSEKEEEKTEKEEEERKEVGEKDGEEKKMFLQGD